MSEKKTPTVAELQKELAKLRKSEKESSVCLSAAIVLSKEEKQKHGKEVQDLRTALKQSLNDYQRACDIARHLSNAVGRLTEARYE